MIGQFAPFPHHGRRWQQPAGSSKGYENQADIEKVMKALQYGAAKATVVEEKGAMQGWYNSITLRPAYRSAARVNWHGQPGLVVMIVLLAPVRIFALPAPEITYRPTGTPPADRTMATPTDRWLPWSSYPPSKAFSV